MRRELARAGTTLVCAGSMLATLGAAHATVNAVLLRRPRPDPPLAPGPVAVLVPARDERDTIAALVADLRAQRGVPQLQVLVLDDASRDGTADIARAAAGDDPRIRVLRSEVEPPPGWLGKPAACHRLAVEAARESDPGVLVFVDADVRLAPHAVAAAVDLLQRSGLDLVSPWPTQPAHGWAERLVQPLNVWSWLTTLPLRLAERSPRPALAAANGQFLAIRTHAYRRAGGHAAVADAVLDDIALLRAVKRTGGRGGPVHGAALASCRMYRTAAELRAGYRKSLWAAFGSPPGAATALAVLALAYLGPPAAAIAGRGWVRQVGVIGYGAGVASRLVAARVGAARALPDALTHPASIGAFAALTAESLLRRRRGLQWKGRPVDPAQLARTGTRPSAETTSRVERDRFRV